METGSLDLLGDLHRPLRISCLRPAGHPGAGQGGLQPLHTGVLPIIWGVKNRGGGMPWGSAGSAGDAVRSQHDPIRGLGRDAGCAPQGLAQARCTPCPSLAEDRGDVSRARGSLTGTGCLPGRLHWPAARLCLPALLLTAPSPGGVPNTVSTSAKLDLPQGPRS